MKTTIYGGAYMPMKTIDHAYKEELLQAYARCGETEVLRLLNNLLADMLMCLNERDTELDKLKRHIHKQLLTAHGVSGKRNP